MMDGAAEVTYRTHLFTVSDFLRMDGAGVFAPDARVELIEGEIIDMAPIGTRHARAVTYLTQQIIEAVGRSAVVRVQNPVVLDDRTEVHPDVAVVRVRDDLYGCAHPRPEDVLLLIEVSDTTLGFDLRVKLPLYARAGIAELWIVDVENAALCVFRAPRGDDYAERRELRNPRGFEPAAMAGTTIDLSDLFSP